MSEQPPPATIADLRTRALAYAAAGVPVFPCVPGGKVPLTPNGFLDATTDVDRVRAWWTQHPQANVATPTGAPGTDVLDVDVRADGDGWGAYRRAREAALLDGWIRAVQTPSGGLHLHYPGTDQRNGSLRGLHVDFRGNGGYVLLPPSLGQTKAYSRRYETQGTRPGPGRPLDWAGVVKLLAPATVTDRAGGAARPRRGTDPTPALAAHVARQPEGNRDNALFWAACRAAEAGVRDFEHLVAAAVTAGLTEREAARTVLSAQRTIGGVAAPATGAAGPTPVAPSHAR